MTISRDEARKAEKAYEKQAAPLIKQLKSLSEKIKDGGEKIKEEYAQAEKSLNELKVKELQRLDQAYANGRLTQSYYDERRFNIETDNLTKIVPFGLDEAPTEKEFKAQYKDELKSKQLGKDDVKMLYERMIHRMRIDDFKFKQIATGGYPKPELQTSELAAMSMENNNQVIRLSIPEANDTSSVQKAEMIHDNQEKTLNKQIS
jgi:hypothetical protein